MKKKISYRMIALVSALSLILSLIVYNFEIKPIFGRDSLSGTTNNGFAYEFYPIDGYNKRMELYNGYYVVNAGTPDSARFMFKFSNLDGLDRNYAIGELEVEFTPPSLIITVFQ